MGEREKILIIFDGPHLAYSPTTIQLYDELSEKFHVTIIAQNPANYNGQELEGREVVYYKYYGVKFRHFYLLFFLLLRAINPRVRQFIRDGLGYRDYFFRYLFLKKHLRGKKYKRIICVDIANLYYCHLLGLQVDFLSLELCKDEQLLRKVNDATILSVLIQSRERYEYLFKNKVHKTFFVQNSPVFHEIKIPADRKNLIYAGGLYSVLGFYHCLEFLKKFPNETLVVQGALFDKDKARIENEYGELLKGNRLIINTAYLENDEVVGYINNYEIGFCFYDFDDPFIKANYFNYASAPSGKMFKYLAAGVPVVCSNIIGFKFVDEFKCGVLIDTLSPEDIEAGIMKIRSNYHEYVENALRAARHFSFDKAIMPYIDFIA